jgi:hypothetical protein
LLYSSLFLFYFWIFSYSSFFFQFSSVGLFPLNLYSHFLRVHFLKLTIGFHPKSVFKNRMDMKYCRGRMQFCRWIHKSIENNWKFFVQRTNWMTLVQFKLLFLLLLLQNKTKNTQEPTKIQQSRRMSVEWNANSSFPDKLRFRKWRIKSCSSEVYT